MGDSSGLEDLEFIIEWPLSVLPRIGEWILGLPMLVADIPEQYDLAWTVWSIDYRDVDGEFMPSIWIEGVEQKERTAYSIDRNHKDNGADSKGLNLRASIDPTCYQTEISTIALFTGVPKTSFLSWAQ